MRRCWRSIHAGWANGAAMRAVGRDLAGTWQPDGGRILRDADAFFTGGSDGVVKTDTLDEATITACALVGHNDIEKRTGFGAAARESNNDHDAILRVEKITSV